MPEFKEVSVSNLRLDRKNPRLPTSLHGACENEILKYLARKTNIEELITSIGKNDFFPGEAIVVTSSGPAIDEYIVLEGNRRLTALRLLNDEQLARQVSAGAAQAVANAKNRPSRVPAYEVDSRDDVLQYLGFRHVSGVQRWDPLAKARYLKMLYLRSEGGPESRYRQIASEIGSRGDTVRKNLDALAAYELVEKEQFFNVPALNEERFQFGVFYTALANPRIAEFAGARNESGPTHPIANPASLNIKEIGELVEWMFRKDESGKTRLGESRKIPHLAAVVSAPSALQRFREGESLDVARLDTPDVQVEFIREIRTVVHHIEQANSKINSVNADDPDVKAIVARMHVASGKIFQLVGVSSADEQRKV